MKAFEKILKVLTLLVSVVTLTMFFFCFVQIGKGDSLYTITGFEAAFGAAAGKLTYYKSAWYMFAFILSALTIVFSGANFKFKGSKYAKFGFSIATFINMLVLFISFPSYFDFRPNTASAIATAGGMIKDIPFLVAFIAAATTMVIATVSMFVSDYVEALESKGAKLPIHIRIVKFFKDYKRELKNITWPSRQTVVKNVIVVLIMCVIVGAYIWILDFGLSKLLEVVLNIGA